MAEILGTASSSELIAAIEEDVRGFWRNWGRAPQATLDDSPDLVRLHTGVPFAFCNGVMCGERVPNDIDAVVAETVSYFRSQKVPWEWIAGPASSPPSLESALSRHGLRVHGELIGMALDLQSLPPDIPWMEDLCILEVDSDEALGLWAQTIVEGFEAPELSPGFVELECSLGHELPSYRRYIGFLNGQPVATASLLLGKEASGVNCVSTVPAARRMGIGALITQYALRQAQTLGHHIGVLQSTPMGRNVYPRLGFKEYSVLRCYSPVE